MKDKGIIQNRNNNNSDIDVLEIAYFVMNDNTSLKSAICEQE